MEKQRSPEEVQAAQYNDTHEDIFLFASALRTKDSPNAIPLFSAARLPRTMELSAHLRVDAGLIDNPLKLRFARLRPYNADPSLRPVCETNQEFSYPSGHTMNGYLYAFALIEILPEQSAQILARADQYAEHRVVCESHYPTDLQASRRAASFVFGYLLAQSGFLTELNAARTETRAALGLPPIAPR